VAVQPAGGGADRLVVFVVLREPRPPGDLRRELGRRLADQLNPLFKVHDVVVTESLPRTASNKLMRRTLRSEYLRQ
jgi:acetyl-CoA synthetase